MTLTSGIASLVIYRRDQQNIVQALRNLLLRSKAHARKCSEANINWQLKHRIERLGILQANEKVDMSIMFMGVFWIMWESWMILALFGQKLGDNVRYGLKIDWSGNRNGGMFKNKHVHSFRTRSKART